MIKKTCSILMVVLASAACHGAIIYSSGPSFLAANETAGSGIDLDNDGSTDFYFWAPGGICTASIPAFCSFSYLMGGPGTSEVLASQSWAQAQALGDWIGGSAPAQTAWVAPASGVPFTAFSFGAGGFVDLAGGSTNAVLATNTLPAASAWHGSLGALGVGYFGVRFHATDGLHYGWIRARLPSRDPVSPGVGEFGPTVIDWAYESRTDTAIQAGAIGDGSGAMMLTIDFGAGQSGAVGSLILVNGILRGELNLAGQYSSAVLRGPAPSRAQVEPIATFGSPLVSGTNYSSFFRDLVLSHAQVNQLLHGSLYISLRNGELIGRISP